MVKAASSVPAPQAAVGSGSVAGQIQDAFHRNVNFVLGGQLSAPMGWRADLKGVIPFAFPVFWNMDR